MTDLLFLGAYWTREESIEECASRLAQFLERLAQLDGRLASWYRKGRRPSTAQGHPIPLEMDAVRELLLAGRNKTDFGGEVIDELGASLSVWNAKDPPVTLSTTCGSSAEGISNHAVLEIFPSAEPDPYSGLERVAAELVRAVVDVWDPDWASWLSNSLLDVQDAAAGEPAVGWITYVNCPPGAVDESLAQIATVRGYRSGTVIELGAIPTSIPPASLRTARERLRASIQ